MRSYLIYLYVDSHEYVTYYMYYSDHIKYCNDETLLKMIYHTKVDNLEPDAKENVLKVLSENEYKYGYYD